MGDYTCRFKDAPVHMEMEMETMKTQWKEHSIVKPKFILLIYKLTGEIGKYCSHNTKRCVTYNI